MTDWSEGYVSDIDYTHGYYRELNPAHLRFALLAKGLRSPDPDAEGFAYCELGFGQGVSLTIHAAANPGGTFLGTDFNPAHAVGARELADRSGVTNLTLHDDSFAELLARSEGGGMPQFDMIVLHGILSWISPENRGTIVAFIRRTLKPGGVVYVSYNALPGWAAMMPLRELMTLHAGADAGEITARIGRSLDFAKKVQEGGSGYFGTNPQVGPRLERLQGMSRNYLAHEYFNRDWVPMYHADVAREFSQAKLAFAATATLSEQVDVVNFNAKGLELLRQTTDPALKETLKDYLVNQQFRRDLYVRGAIRLPGVEQIRQVRATRFALVVPRDTVPTSITFPVGKVDMKQEIYAPILDQLAQGPATFGDLVDRAGITSMPFSALLQAMVILCSQNWVAPCRSAAGDAGRAVVTARFNRFALDRAMHSAAISVLASPVCGGGVAVDRVHQLFLAAEREGRDPTLTAMAGLRELNQRLITDGKTLTSEEETVVELGNRLTHFQGKIRPLLQQLGVV